MPRPGFGTQRFGTSSFGGGGRDIKVTWSRLRARTITGGDLHRRTVTARVVPQ